MPLDRLQADAHAAGNRSLRNVMDLVQDEHLAASTGHRTDDVDKPCQFLRGNGLSGRAGTFAGGIGQFGTRFHPLATQGFSTATINRSVMRHPSQQRYRLAHAGRFGALQQAYADVVHHLAGQPG